MTSIIEKEGKFSGASGDSKGAASKKRIAIASLTVMAATTLFYLFGFELFMILSKWSENKTEVPTAAPTAAPTEAPTVAPTVAPTPYTMENTMLLISGMAALLGVYIVYRAAMAIYDKRDGIKRAVFFLFPALLGYILFFYPAHSIVKLVFLFSLGSFMAAPNGLFSFLTKFLNSSDVTLVGILVTLMLVIRLWMFVAEFYTYVSFVDPRTVMYYKVLVSVISLTALFGVYAVAVAHSRNLSPRTATKEDVVMIITKFVSFLAIVLFLRWLTDLIVYVTFMPPEVVYYYKVLFSLGATVAAFFVIWHASKKLTVHSVFAGIIGLSVVVMLYLDFSGYVKNVKDQGDAVSA